MFLFSINLNAQNMSTDQMYKIEEYHSSCQTEYYYDTGHTMSESQFMKTRKIISCAFLNKKSSKMLLHLNWYCPKTKNYICNGMR